MKKTLLASTALAAVGAIALAGPAYGAAHEKKAGGPIKVSVGGYMEQWFGFADSDDNINPGDDGFDQQTDAEIHFKGETTLDNGLTFGINVQLEAQTDGDQIDEQFAYVEGSFGRLLMGSENSASYLMHYGIPSFGVGTDSGDHDNWIAGFDFTGARTNGRGPDNDSEKVTYFTPRFMGFQVGASYVPEIQQDVDGFDVGGASRVNNGNRDNSFAVAANFNRSFEDFKIQASAGYQDFGDDNAVAGSLESFQFGLRLGFAGFTAAGTYGEEDRAPGSTQETIGLGVTYAAGPFGVSLNYIGSERDNTQQEQDAFELGARYKLGPGIEARGSLLYAEGDNAAGAQIAEGFAVVGGLKLGF